MDVRLLSAGDDQFLLAFARWVLFVFVLLAMLPGRCTKYLCIRVSDRLFQEKKLNFGLK